MLLPVFLKKNENNWHLRPKGSYFYPVQITGFSSAEIPCLNLVIENVQVPVKIDLGFSGGICVPNETLKNLHKSFVQGTNFQGLRGKIYNTNIYELPEIKIGPISLHQVKVEEGNSEFENDVIFLKNAETFSERDFGRIGWKLFSNLNVLLDCKLSTIAFCDSLETLKKHQRFPLTNFSL